jgi:hypothetical protein
MIGFKVGTVSIGVLFINGEVGGDFVLEAEFPFVGFASLAASDVILNGPDIHILPKFLRILMILSGH